MNITLIGYGKMGKQVERSALARGHSIDLIIDSKTPLKREHFDNSDVYIDFSTRSAVLDNVKAAAAAGKNIVIGTTGWDDLLPEVAAIVLHANIACIHSPNFSIGIALFHHLVKQAAQKFAGYPHYDVGGYEIHHKQKADSPSGTAKALLSTLIHELPNKQSALHHAIDRPITEDELHFASIRTGAFPGTHTVFFDSPYDTVTLTHQARTREGFAEGAVIAAEWLQGKHGIFTMDDLLTGV